MAGELNFKAVFDYGDAKKSVDELYDILEKGSVKMNEAFSFGRAVEANRKQLREMISITRQTLVELESVYRSTMDEIKEAGGLEYVSEQERQYLENLKDGIDSARKMIRGLEENLKEQNFNKNIFAGLTQGLQGLMGAYTAASGVIAQFSGESENLEKIQTKLQASMSILMGVQQVYNALQSTSTFRTQVLAKATELLTAAETKLAAASGIAKVALGGLVVVLAAAVGALAAFASREEKSITLSKEFADAVVSNSARQVLAYRKLQAEWEQANGSLERQKEIIASDEWKQLGISVNTINDAEKALVDQSEAVIRSMVAKAKAAALLAEAQNDIAKAVRNELKAENSEEGNYTTGQKFRATFLRWLPGSVYTQQGIVNGEYVNSAANAPKREDYATRREFRDAWLKYIGETDAMGFRDLANTATENAMETIRQSSEYEALGDDILRSLGLLDKNNNNVPVVNNLPEVLEKIRKQVERELRDVELETEQAHINTMNEGAARTLRQIAHNYDKEKEAIKRWEEDLIDEKIARDKQLWEADPKNNGKEFEYKRNDYTLTEAELDLKEARQAEADSNRLGGIQKVFDNYLTFAEKFNRAASGFESDMDALVENGASIEALGVASKQAEEAFDALAKQWAESGWDEGLIDMTALLNDLELQLQVLEGTATEFTDNDNALLLAQIKALKKALEGANSTTETSEEDWTKLNKVLSDTAPVFEQMGDMVGGVLGEMLKITGNFATNLAKIQVGIKGLQKPGASFTEKLTAGVSIASSALSIISTIVGKIRESIEHTNQLRLATEQYHRTLERIKDSEALNGLVNAFGTNSLGQFVKNMEIAQDAQKNIQDLFNNFQGAGGPWGTGFWDATINQHFWDNDLISDMRNGWQKFWSVQSNIFTANWSDFYDENGNLMGEDLKAWYETYGKGLSTNNKELVEGVIAEWDRWKEAVDEISEYLGTLFNNVTSNLADKMLDNFIKTGNAIVDMTDYMNDFSRAIAKSIIQGQLLDKVFDKTAQDTIGRYITEGKIGEAVAYYNNLLGQANELAPAFNQWLEGINFNESTSQSATAGGFQTMSQDVANELNGRFAALQIAGENILLESRGIHTDTSAMAVSVEEMRNLSLISMGYLEGIEKNTHVLPDMAERLEKIEKYSKQMVS